MGWLVDVVTVAHFQTLPLRPSGSNSGRDEITAARLEAERIFLPIH